ncbi:hypothetical protein VB10N_23010 [Vibrio sp. 10N]|nr:hypothetical protein VB10N_23010 [Vibrio sp. 10N]
MSKNEYPIEKYINHQAYGTKKGTDTGLMHRSQAKQHRGYEGHA